jgi:hypothetical protein
MGQHSADGGAGEKRCNDAPTDKRGEDGAIVAGKSPERKCPAPARGGMGFQAFYKAGWRRAGGMGAAMIAGRAA